MLGLGNSLTGGGGGVQSLIPSEISGLDLHLKFNTGIAGASNTTAAGNMSNLEVIHSWADQSGKARHALQTTDDHRPLWTDATTDISFDGNDDHFDLAQYSSANIEIPVNTDFTIMIRHKFPNFSGSYALIGHGGSDVLKVNDNTNITVKLSSTARNFVEEGGLTLATDVYYIFTLVRSGGGDGDIKIYVHGGAYSDKSWDDDEAPQDADDFTLSNIGASADGNLNPIGFMRDVIVWNGTALNAPQRADMYSYINAQ